MQQLNALQVAIKDRPKIFKVIVFSLFSFSLFVVVICAILQMKALSAAQDKKSVTASRRVFGPASFAASSK
jgi:hypothetical protein